MFSQWGPAFLGDVVREDQNTTNTFKWRFAGGPIMAKFNAGLVALLFSMGSRPDLRRDPIAL